MHVQCKVMVSEFRRRVCVHARARKRWENALDVGHHIMSCFGHSTSRCMYGHDSSVDVTPFDEDMVYIT